MRPLPILALALLAAAPGSTRTLLGQYGHWGAFRDGRPPRCFAIAQPVSTRGAGAPFAAFVGVRGQGFPVQFHVRLSRAPRTSEPVALRIGGERFVLLVAGRDAWARDARADARIVALGRGATRMEVAGIDARGRRFGDAYSLAGAASAIDAALLGCLPR